MAIRTTHPDSTGRYRFDSLAAGRYTISLSSALLDSLGLSIPDREIVIAGEAATLDYTLPSGAVLRDAMCPGAALGNARAVVAGHALDATTDAPLTGAKVVFAWSDFSVDSALQPKTGERATSVRTGARGEYRLCGVPTGAWLTMQLQFAGRASTPIRVTASDSDGVIVRDLSLNTTSDSASADLVRTGAARVTGRVRGAGGFPLPGAEVYVEDARGVASTDALGSFALNGLPDGTQILSVRRLGYAPAEVQVELRSGRSVTRDVQMSRVVSLDTVRISEYRTRYREFYFNRGVNFNVGDFLTAEMLARSEAVETGDLVNRMPGFNVVGHGAVAKVFTKKTTMAGSGCTANVVVDGVEEMGVNDVAPSQVQGIETYVSPPRPSIYHRRGCGLVVIWTTRWRQPAKPR